MDIIPATPVFPLVVCGSPVLAGALSGADALLPQGFPHHGTTSTLSRNLSTTTTMEPGRSTNFTHHSPPKLPQYGFSVTIEQALVFPQFVPESFCDLGSLKVWVWCGSVLHGELA